MLEAPLGSVRTSVPSVRLAVVMLMVGVAAAACTPKPVETTTTTTLGGSPSPAAALEALIGALGADDPEATRSVTFDDQLALLIGLEGSDGSDALLMLNDGVPDQMRANFWRSFADSFPAFAEEELTELRVGETEAFSVEGESFATVAVALRGLSGSGEWIARKDLQGRWRMDLFATFGPSFARPFREWLSRMGNSVEADRIRSALAGQRASLLAALQREPLGPISSSTMAEVDALLIEVDL